MDKISQIKWHSYTNGERPTKNGRYLVIMPQFTYDENMSFDINVLIYSVLMDDWCYLWGSSVEKNKLPVYWAEIDVKSIIKINNINNNTIKIDNNIKEVKEKKETINILFEDADMHVKYMPKSVMVNSQNLSDVLEIWRKDDKLKKYADTYEFWRNECTKYLSPICSNPALYLFFIECYKSAKKGENGFFIEKVCYSTNIMWRNEFKFQRLIMSWHSGEEKNVDKLLAEAERIQKDKEEFEKKKEAEIKVSNNQIDDEFITQLKENIKLPEGFELYYDNLKDVNRIWDDENGVTCLLSDILQKELKELKFKFVYADYHDMMRAIYKNQVDKINKRKWQFWQSCLKMANEESCNFTLWYIPEQFKVTDKNTSLLLTKRVWAIFWGGYKLMSWDCQFNENGELIKPELSYDVKIMK